MLFIAFNLYILFGVIWFCILQFSLYMFNKIIDDSEKLGVPSYFDKDIIEYAEKLNDYTKTLPKVLTLLTLCIIFGGVAAIYTLYTLIFKRKI